MLKLSRSEKTWWQKPLAEVEGRYLPAELVVLQHEVREGECGAWLNSLGIKTGVIDLAEDRDGRFKTVRITLPKYVQECLKEIYSHPELSKGVYDLVIWNDSEQTIRFVEVKCPQWDHQTAQQKRFSELANERNIQTDIAEWKFM
jgi:hypothetical protein